MKRSCLDQSSLLSMAHFSFFINSRSSSESSSTKASHFLLPALTWALSSQALAFPSALWWFPQGHHGLHVLPHPVSPQSSCSFLAAASDVASHCLLCDTLAALGSTTSRLPAFSPTPSAFQFLDSSASCSLPRPLDVGFLWSSVFGSPLPYPSGLI